MMQPSCQDGPKKSVSFFTSLRRLGREMDEGVKTLQEQLDGRCLECKDSSNVALKGLLDRRIEVDTLKSECRSLMSEMTGSGKTFEVNLQACGEMLDLHLLQLSAVQAHLMQYGFVPQPEADSAAGGSQEMKPEEEATPGGTPAQQLENKYNERKSSNLTPRLEDFGVSSFTLNMLNRRPQPSAAFKVPADAAVPQTRVVTGSEATRHDSVPDMFWNDGLTVTPSLFPSTGFASGNRSGYEAYSPEVVSGQDGVGGAAVDDSVSHDGHPSEVARILDFSDSPVPPVLQTPGIEQIPHIHQVFNRPPPGERGPVARQLKLGVSSGVRDDSTYLDSPEPPVLSTPGIQQITRTLATASRVTGQQAESLASSQTSDPLAKPRTPEFTYSLKDLQNMTMSFRQIDPSSTFSQHCTTTSTTSSTSDLRLPEPTQSASQREPHEVRDAPILRQPHEKVTTSYLSHHYCGTESVSVSEPQLSTWSTEDVCSLDLPPTPELTMSYSSCYKPVATTTLPSTHSYIPAPSPVPSAHSYKPVATTTVPSAHSYIPVPTHVPSAHSYKPVPNPRPSAHSYKPVATTTVPSTHSYRPQSGLNSRQDSREWWNESCAEERSFSSVDDASWKLSEIGTVSNIENRKRLGVSHKPVFFSNSSNMGKLVTERNSQILHSTENRLLPLRGEECKKVDGSGRVQAALDRSTPLTEGSLDVPNTPNFLGSYHFMGSKH